MHGSLALLTDRYKVLIEIMFLSMVIFHLNRKRALSPTAILWLAVELKSVMSRQ